MPKKSLYIPAAIDAFIGAQAGESYSGRLAYLLGVAQLSMADAVPELTIAEWLAVAAAVRGYAPVYESGPTSVLRGAWADVLAGDGYADAASMHAATGQPVAVIQPKPEALARKLRGLPLVSQAAVLEVARVYLRAHVHAHTPAARRALLLEAGARLAPEQD